MSDLDLSNSAQSPAEMRYIREDIVNKLQSKIDLLQKKVDILTKSNDLMTGMCGHPDAASGCRLILKHLKQCKKEIEGLE